MAELISAGPTSFTTEGERKAAILLQQYLPSDWIIICNKIVPTNNGRSFEIDFIILARRWIFLLDEKSWKGRISGNDLQWVRADGSATKSPLNQIDFNAKVVAGQIKYKVTPLNQNGYFVRGGVLLSLQEYLPQIHDARAANNIFLLSDVCQRLRKLDGSEGNPLVGHWQEKIKQAFVHYPERPRVPSQIHSFKIEDAISPRPNMRIFDASLEGNAEEKYQLMVYDLGNDPFAAQQLDDFYRQEYRAIKKLQSTGLAPEAQVPFIWSEDYLVVAITPPAGKALKAWPLPETTEEFLHEVQFASNSFKALDQIHASGVIHRALGPEALYVQSMQPPKVMFTNFYAARTGTNTIAPSLDALSIEDPYASIDVAIGYEFASTITDTFSLALILLERLSGSSISNLRPNIVDKIVIPDQPRWSSFLITEQAEELVEILQSVIQPGNGAKPLSAKEVATRLAELARRARSAVNGESGTILCKRYEVQRLLGQGMMAKTYLVKDTSFAELGSYVLKQFIRIDEGARQQAVAEYKALKDLSSKYIPRIEYIFPPEEDAHILMQYIPGLTLQQVESEFPWPLERWWEFARHFLNAIDVLEQKTLLHRDIKPANIILHEEDNRPVLIDFGFAIQRGIKGHIAGTPLYLPPETLSLAQTPYSADRYAAAIVLFNALTGMLPFTIAADGVRTILPLETFGDQKVRRIAIILQKAVSNNPGERPESVNQLQNDLQLALLAVEEPPGPVQELQAEHNDWVDSIRSLYQNSDAGNANNRGLDSDFVRDTYILTMLDQQLLPLLFERLPKALFLSGNPGDGKTAFLEQVYLELQRRQATVVHKDASGWEVVYEGHTFRSCYDASESHQQQSADEQLSEKLHGLDGQQPMRTNLTVLIAINDGRLFDFFQQQRAQFPWLAQQIDLATEEEDSEKQDVWLIDMKKRAFVGLPEADELSIFSHILSSFVAPEKWTICEQCVAQTVCPLRNNAQALHKKKIAVRLEYLFLLTHLRRLSHITMRDLRSALAYLITGNKSCQDVHQMRSGAEIGSSLINLTYWQNTFTRTDTRDELLNNLTSLDPARFPRPHLDRFLHFHQTLDDAEQRRLLFTDKQDLPSRRFKDSSEWIAAVKRRLYFEAGKSDPESSLPFVGWNLLLPYRFANKFWQLLDKRINSEKIIEKLALGILRSDEVWEEIPPGAMSIKVNSSDAQQLVVLKQIQLHEFELLVPYQLNTQMIETLPEILVLQHKTGTPRLEITLDLFELLMQMADGLQPDAREYEPLLEDLKLFKNALLLQETQDLILVESQFHIHHIMQRDGKIIRQTI